MVGPARADRIRGITLSTHTNGSDWAGDGVAPAFRAMRATGAGWVAIHPYARVDVDGSVRFLRLDPEHPPEFLARPIREAHALGLKVLVKPHLAYWGSPFSWRGEIAFTTDAQWERFWSQYTGWIVNLAEASRGADAFAVGTELDRTIDREERWRSLIAEVRSRTGLPLTYAANWTDYERVGFWDALDAIGIQAYFPVADSAQVTPEAIRTGWERRMKELARFSRVRDRHIVFTELGYNRSHHAPVTPWSYGVDGEDAEAVQELSLRIALEAIENEPRVIGCFLWKWFPEPHPVGRNFQLATPRLLAAIRSVWLPREWDGPPADD